MQNLLTLVCSCLVCAVNVLARGKLKEHCLTFGDVLVASASHPELRIKGLVFSCSFAVYIDAKFKASECMVNAAESFRRKYSHTCHKHCFNPEESKTGDEIGHCQKCKKWNSNDKFANLPQPAIATKIKRSLISNLGNTALTQMCLLMFCSMLMIAASLTVATM